MSHPIKRRSIRSPFAHTKQTRYRHLSPLFNPKKATGMKYKSYSLHNYSTMPQYEKLSPEIRKGINVVGSVLPFKVNNYVLEELIDWENYEDDPIFRLTFPHKDMLYPSHFHDMSAALDDGVDREFQKLVSHNIRLQLNPHPAGQQAHNVPHINGERLNGLQHKYRETALFFPKPRTDLPQLLYILFQVASVCGNGCTQICKQRDRLAGAIPRSASRSDRFTLYGR